MLASVTSAALTGIDAVPVRVEANISKGLPGMLLVGLPDAAVKESRERVRAALQNSGLPWPMRRMVINLAPADIRKEGPAFDLPIALALLRAQAALPPDCLAATIVIGELTLGGELQPVRGAVSFGLLAAQQGFRRIIAPPGNAAEVALVHGLEVITPANLAQTVAFLRGLPPRNFVVPPAVTTSAAVAAAQPDGLDLADVRGQAEARRALEIAAAGNHNLLMTGPPGSGKSMLAARLPGILPPLGSSEALTVTRIHSAAGLSPGALITVPPFRTPHATISPAGLTGGGALHPRPGEISLAQHGVLFMDELPEFQRRVLELLRRPLEEGVITISRARSFITLPARFQLVAASNPCPCGEYGSPDHECSCSPLAVARYQERISGPLLDRIDLHVSLPALGSSELLRAPGGEGSAAVQQRVISARQVALARQGSANSLLAGKQLRQHTMLDSTAHHFLRTAARRLTLSGRGFDRLLRVARTISDLQGAGRIREQHLAEAVGYIGRQRG
jgi:magnesium chelatase family protein